MISVEPEVPTALLEAEAMDAVDDPQNVPHWPGMRVRSYRGAELPFGTVICS